MELVPPNFVPRPVEPVVKNGRGMHVMGFMKPSVLKLVSKQDSSSKVASTSSPAAPEAGKSECATISNADLEHDEHKHSQDVSTAPELDGGSNGKVRGPCMQANGRYLYLHGNYWDYNRYRHGKQGQGQIDPRLKSIVEHLGEDFFRGQDVLDIGCNHGLVALAIARHYGAQHVLGVDIDAALIEAAQQSKESSTGDSDTSISVEFRAEDFLSMPARRVEGTGKLEKFDIILCLSVTKWIHFYHGDTGIRKMFKRCLKRLRPGGFLILEPQEWESYKKKRHITREVRQTVASIELRPEHFDNYLRGLGFKRKCRIHPPDNVFKNWQRVIRVFKKPRVGVLAAANDPEAVHHPDSNQEEGNLEQPATQHCKKKSKQQSFDNKTADGRCPQERKKKKSRASASICDTDLNDNGGSEHELPATKLKKSKPHKT